MSRLSGLFRKRGHHGAHMTRLSVSQAVHSASMCEDAGPGRGRGREREKEGGREAHRRRRRGRRPAETDHSSPGQLFTHRRTDGRGAAAATAPARTNLCSAYSSPLPAVRPSVLRSPIARPRRRRGCRQRRRERTGDRRADGGGGAHSEQAGEVAVRAGAAAAAAEEARSVGQRAAAAAAADRGKNHSCSSVSVAPLSQVDCYYSVLSNVGVKIARREAAGAKVQICRL